MNVLSKQTFKIEEYVRYAESLPTELSAVKVYLGYDTSVTPALSPDSMQQLFTEIKSHASLWNEISRNAKEQLRELSIIAASVVKDGNGLIRGLEALGPVNQIINQVGSTSISKSDITGNKVLDESTIARLNNLQPYIDVLHSTSLDKVGDINKTNKQLSDFRTQSSVLEAKVAGKVEALKEDNDGSIGKEKTVEPMIESYKEAKARIIAQFGEGSEAAKEIKEQIDNILSELTDREADLQKQQRLTYAVGRLFIHLQGLGYAMIDAQSSLTKIWLSSSKTCTRLNSIAGNLGNIKKEDLLLNFYIDFKQIHANWASIKDEAASLYMSL